MTIHMDVKSEYELLYQHWQRELNQLGITPFTQENFSTYKALIDEIKNTAVQEQDKIKDQLIKAYQDNANFLLTDFLKIREMKLMNAALALQEIDFTNLIEAEKMFYQNLVSAIKGFEKMKALSAYDVTKGEILPKGETLNEDISKSIEPTGITREKLSQDVQDTGERQALISDLVDERKADEFTYTLVRFLKKTPALVGIDLVNYGPFEKEDVANMPFKNAKILLFEKFAEKIEID